MKVLLLVAATKVSAQYPANADGLRALIRMAPHDTTKAQATLLLAVAIQDARPDSVKHLCDEALRIATHALSSTIPGTVAQMRVQKAVYRRIQATAILNMGCLSHQAGETVKAMERYDQAFSEFKRLGFNPGARDALTAMSALFTETGHLAEAEWAGQTAREYKGAPTVRYGFIAKCSARSQTDSNAEMPPGDRTPVNEPVAVPTSPARTAIEVPQGGSGEASTAHTPPRDRVVDTLRDAVHLEPIAPVQVLYANEGAAALAVMGVDTAMIARRRLRLAQPVRRVGGAIQARDEFEMGEAWQLIREPDMALTSFERSYALFRAVRSDSGECVALLRIGELLGNRGEHEEAFAALDSARLKARTIGRADLEGIALAGMGDMCRRIEECGGAAELYRRSIELALAAGDRRTEARGYLGITEGLLRGGAPAQAEPIGQRGFKLAAEVDDPDLKRHGAELLQGIYTELGRLEEAHEMGELASSIRAFIIQRDRAMDSIIHVIRSDFLRTRQEDSLTHQRAQSALESNWREEQERATVNKRLALTIALLSTVIVLAGWAYYRFDRRRRQRRAERRAMDLEMRALRAQMNPHFLFNALSSIHAHILENQAEIAAGFLAKFTKLMRQVLEMSRLNDVPLKRELEVLAAYAELEQMRLKDRFSYTVEVSPDVDPEAVAVPPMLLQPFVENAVWHGLARKSGPGTLKVSAWRANGALHIAIDDDGVGRQEAKGKGSGHASLGTSITRERLDLWAAQCRAPASFTFVPVPVGTRVLLVLPWVEVQ
ncbi:MAG: histidine kinase [Flavobacteriales bacterium]|nr:MAG: histidine kinase [Flavobacteriales bacterium]